MTRMDWVANLTEGLSIEGIINALGVGALAILFATDRLKTRAQNARELATQAAAHDKLIAEKDKTHDATIAALTKSHEAVVAALIRNHADALAGRDERNAELKQSLVRLEEARNLERDRAHNATETLGRAVDAIDVNNHLLESLGKATKKGSA